MPPIPVSRPIVRKHAIARSVRFIGVLLFVSHFRLRLRIHHFRLVSQPAGTSSATLLMAIEPGYPPKALVVEKTTVLISGMESLIPMKTAELFARSSISPCTVKVPRMLLAMSYAVMISVNGTATGEIQLPLPCGLQRGPAQVAYSGA